MDDIFQQSNEQLEKRLRQHNRIMRLMPLVFVVCILLIVLTVALVLNDFAFYVWLPVFLPTLAGQWWLANGGRWRK
jgi:peptidoglycan/LPS O-acetylase OafA/YrhL